MLYKFLEKFIINKLSGPFSAYLLTPKKDANERMKKMGIDLNLPVFLNFGDLHMGRYDCQEQYKDKCNELGCTSIDSDNFLRLLDKLGEQYNIDLYLEAFHEKITTENRKLGESKGYYSHLASIINNNFDCFFKRNKETVLKYGDNMEKEYKIICPTENIKWHFTDARHTGGLVENKKNLIRGFKHSNYQSLLNYIHSFITMMIREKLDEPNLPKSIIRKYDLNEKEYEILFFKIKKTLDSLFLDESNLVNDFLLSTHFGEDKSLVYKQFKKHKHKDVIGESRGHGRHR